MANKISALPITENRPIFEDLVTQALKHAKSLGASDAAAEVSEAQGLAITVRKGDVETVEQTRDRSMDITVFAGQRRGSASTSDFSTQALRDTVEAAWHIARYTAEDPAAGLPDEALLAKKAKHNLSLHHRWKISVSEATELAIAAEHAALQCDKRISNTEGASVDTHEGHFVLGNTRGFLDGYAYSRAECIFWWTIYSNRARQQPFTAGQQYPPPQSNSQPQNNLYNFPGGWDINDLTGVVSLRTSYYSGGGAEVVTNDGIIKVICVAQRSSISVAN